MTIRECPRILTVFFKRLDFHMDTKQPPMGKKKKEDVFLMFFMVDVRMPYVLPTRGKLEGSAR